MRLGRFLLFIFVISSFIFVPHVFAVGSGAGGASCTQDVWTCGEWTTCLPSGSQSRKCTLTSDCTFVNTPKPPETQSCTAFCSEDIWECGEWGSCTRDQQTRACRVVKDCPQAATPRPLETQFCSGGPGSAITNCTADTFSCGAWGSCTNGRQVRKCERSFDCVYANTATPTESRACGKEQALLQCEKFSLRKERIHCRLGLSETDLKRELSLLYLPEYCRTEGTEGEKNECVSLYRSFNECWNMPFGEARNECARRIVGFSSGGEICEGKTGTELASCKGEMREQVEHLVLFHLYEFEVRAENLLRQGKVTRESVTAFDDFIEGEKAEVGGTEDLDSWKRTIVDVRRAWKTFIKDVRL